MVSNITSGERSQLASYLERHAVRIKTSNYQNNSVKDLVNMTRTDIQSSSSFKTGLEDTAYAKYLDKVFSTNSNVNISGSGVDIQISAEAQKILDLTSSKDEEK